MHDKGYTQREWDRTVGWGKVPDKYRRVLKFRIGLTKRSDQNREKNERTSKESKE